MNVFELETKMRNHSPLVVNKRRIYLLFCMTRFVINNPQCHTLSMFR